MRFYTGIGSRSTPPDQLLVLTEIASALERYGFILRSGGAEGADKAFENGVKDPLNRVILRPKHSTKEAEEMASKIHPMWSACDEYARKLHGRNVQLVLGEKLDTPSEFVIAWTFDGENRGGTRTGLKLAKALKIPTFNLANWEDSTRFGIFLSAIAMKAKI